MEYEGNSDGLSQCTWYGRSAMNLGTGASMECRSSENAR